MKIFVIPVIDIVISYCLPLLVCPLGAVFNLNTKVSENLSLAAVPKGLYLSCSKDCLFKVKK